MLTTIIILILLAAGFYVWRKQKAAKAAKNVPTVTAPEPAAPAPPVAVPPANGGANDPKVQ
jgi:hypothetical protein